MATGWLTRKPVADAAVALVSLGTSSHLLESLRAKGVGTVHVTDNPKQIISLARSSEIDLIVLALEGPGLEENELGVIRALREGEQPPALIVMVRFDAVERELKKRLARALHPEQILTGAVPMARLLHLIEEQLTKRCQAKLPELASKEQASFAELLAGLWREKRSGELRVMREGVQTIIYLRKGLPIFAEQGSSSDLLGRFLVETGKITEAKLSEAIAILTSQIVENEQLQLGSVLINMGLLTADDLYKTLTAQVRRKIARCFGAGSYFAELREGEEYVEDVTAFELSMPEVLKEGLQQTSIAQVEAYLGPNTMLFPLLGQAARSIDMAYRLGGADAGFLDEIDGTRTVADLRLTSAVGPERAGRLLMALSLGGALRFATKPKTSPAKKAVPARAEAKAEPKPEPKTKPKATPYGTARKPDEDDDPSWVRIKSLVGRSRKKPPAR
jgi:hypothetical protein